MGQCERAEGCGCDVCAAEREAAAVLGDEVARELRDAGEAAASAWLRRRLGARVPNAGQVITPSKMREAIERRLEQYVEAGVLVNPQVTVTPGPGGTFDIELQSAPLGIVIRQVGEK